METLIKNMTKEQLEKVITSNENLQNKVLKFLQEDTFLYIKDILNDLNVSNYSIELYDYSYISYNDLNSFIKGILKVQKDYGIFGMDKKEYIKRLNGLLSDYEEAEEESKEIEIISELEELAYEIKGVILYFLVGSLDFSSDDIVGSFLDLYYENFENYYIKDDDFSKLYIMKEETI